MAVSKIANHFQHVIFNRVGAPGFPDTLHNVIWEEPVFVDELSSMSISTDPQYNLPKPSVSDPESPSYLDAANIVNAIVGGTNSDPTSGALYYADLEESTSSWFFRDSVEDPLHHPVRATIGHQVFYA